MIKDIMNVQIAIAMKEHQQDRLDALRLIKSQLLLVEKSGQPYNEQVEIKTLMKMVASHEDSIKQFESANRLDLAEKEKHELEIIKEFIPEQPSDEDIQNYTEHAIIVYFKENGIALNDIGTRHIKPIMDIVKAKYDSPSVGKIVSNVIKNKTLSNKN